MLGKRARQPMRKTTSMKDFSFDASFVLGDASQPSETAASRQRAMEARKFGGAAADWLGTLNVAGQKNRRNSADLTVRDSAPFLMACGLCKRSLGPGRDTYMYRGEVAFCSLECRHQQMILDERKDKCSSQTSVTNPPTSDQSGTGETIAAA